MAHINDLKAARDAANRIEDPYDRAEILTEVAKASAFTDLAAAVEDFVRDARERG